MRVGQSQVPLLGSMIGYDEAIVLRGNYGFRLQQDLLPKYCTAGQRPSYDCAMFTYSIISAAVALCVLMIRVAQPLFRLRPLWMKPFIEEFHDHGEDLQMDAKRSPSHLTTALLIIIPLGLVSQVVTALYPTRSFAGLLPVLSWVMIQPLE